MNSPDAWKPPADPDPREILNQANEEMSSGNHARALEMFLWFHRHSLDINPALRGVRLSFALGFWYELALKYPPAMNAMIDLRDQKAEQFSPESPSGDEFREIQALNHQLGDQKQTVQLFELAFNANAANIRQLYEIVENDLIRAGKVENYLEFHDPASRLKHLRKIYQSFKNTKAKFLDNSRLDTSLDKMLLDLVRTQIALLVLAGRDTKAREIAEQVETEMPEFNWTEELSSAFRGEIPPPI